MTGARTESKISGTYHELVGRKHGLTYDHQGNRKTHSRNNHTTNYSSNNLNQYRARTNHGFLLVEGTSTNATVKVYETGSTEETATRLSAGDAQAGKNNYYFRDWDPDTTSTASDYPEINIKEGTTVSATKNAWIPAVSETPITYDSNGNLTADALWTYTYDEENRLIQMEETSAAATAGFPDTTITFKYDYLGRRVEKKVVRGTTTESHLRFVWRGWLMVAELNAASDNARVKTYTWGPDISGSFGGAGGNGGVLIFQDHTSKVNESFYPAYDAQGNVTGLIDTDGNLDAAYEYDPFGKLIRHAGTRSTSMSLLYGTKYTDMETGLIYYGYRYYDPRQGRFINRDPIGEAGGLNLYGMVGNNPVNAIDYLGLCGSPPTRPLGSNFDRRDDDEVDRYEKALEQWDDDYDEWRDCIRAKRRREEPGWWGPSGDGSDIYVLGRFEVVETYGNDSSINTSRILAIGRWVISAPLSFSLDGFWAASQRSRNQGGDYGDFKLEQHRYDGAFLSHYFNPVNLLEYTRNLAVNDTAYGPVFNLNEKGLIDAFRNTPATQEAIAIARQKVLARINVTSARGILEGSLDERVVDNTDYIYSLGRGILYVDFSVFVGTDSFQGVLYFNYSDAFQDPFGLPGVPNPGGYPSTLYFEIGTPYPITGSFFEGVSGTLP